MNPFKTAFAPGNRLPTAVILALVAILPFYVWHENTSGFLTDDAMHLMLADFFSPWYDRNYLVEHYVAARARFPPGFPLLLALLGGGSQNMPVAHLATAACFVLSALLFFAWARRTLGAGHAALACLLIYIFLPESMLYVLELRSELLYMALVFAALLLLGMSPGTQRRQREVLIAASFVISLCMLTRSIGVVLFAAFLMHMYFNRIGNKALYVAVFCILPLAWLAIKEINGYSGNYTEDLNKYLDPDGIQRLVTGDVPRNAVLIYKGLAEHLAVFGGAGWLFHTLAAIIISLSIIGAIDRARHRSVDFFYLLLYIPPILVWPHPFHITRLIYPLVPFVLVYAMVGARNIAALLPGGWATRSYIPVAFLAFVLITPNVAFVADRYTATLPEQLREDFRHTRPWLRIRDPGHAYSTLKGMSSVIDLLSRAEKRIPPMKCAYASHPVSFMLYTNRLSIVAPSKPAIENFKLCDYLFVMNLIGLYKAGYPLDDIQRDRLKLIDIEYDSDQVAQALLFRIKR